MDPREPKTRAQLAEEYGVSRKTFYNWLKRLDIRLPPKRYLPPEDQQRIHDALNAPAGKNGPSKSGDE